MIVDRRLQAGFTLTELLFVTAVAATLTGLAVPVLDHAVDDLQTASAARYLAGRIRGTRVDALKRGAAVALRFEDAQPDYIYTPFVDGNGNGVRTQDIAAGIDQPIGPSEQLGDKFTVRFGLLPGVPDADGAPTQSLDGVRIGLARILTMSPDGTATAGTLYVHGRHAQYAVRVLGVTARTRVLKYEKGSGKWVSR
jgi:prepilin-type N-terminal cleavage/methylation domain-containing protein